MNKAFYIYTINKALKSISTWVTLAIAAIPIYIVAFIADSEYIPMVLYFTFPLFIIFITYRAGGLFRDEIENQTMLTIQSKPITRKQIVIQGYIALMTIILASVVIVALIPGIISVIKEHQRLLDKLLMTLTLYMLGCFVAAIALLLSLVMKGKSYIGVMLGAFGSGFYVLFGLSTFLQAKTGIDNKMQTVIRHMDQQPNIYSHYDSDTQIYTITATGGTTTKLSDFYDDLNHITNIYDRIKWIDPSLQWATMFGAPTRVDTKYKENDVLQAIFDSKETVIKDLKMNASNDAFSFKIITKRTLPLWYTYILWTSISATVITLSLRKIQKINIA